MASLMPNGKQQYFDSNGNPLAGGKVNSYAAGTSTPLATYSDQAGATPNANPVILDSRGEATIFWGSAPYKVVLKTSADVEVWTQDNMYAQADAQSIASDIAIRLPEIANYATLRAYAGTLTAQYVRGVASILDGGAGVFRVDSADTTSADDGGTILVDALGRRWKREYAGSAVEYTKWFGVKADGTTNDGANTRSAFASFGTFGGEINFSRGTYKLDATGGACVSISKPISIDGDGGVYTAINPGFAAGTDNTLSISPATTTDATLTHVSGIALHDPTTGTRTGNHGIFCNTQTAGANLSKFTLRDVIVGQGSNATSWGVYHLNTVANNANGGMYAALIQNNAVKGGVRLESSGDSISVLHNVLSGTRTGVWADLAVGASLLEVQSNNITTSDGAIHIDAGSRFRILGNNIENTAAGALANNNAAVIDINGANGTMYGGVIKENLVSAFGSTNATTLIRLRNCQGTLVEDNVLLSGVAGVTTGIDVGSTCQNVRVGANTYNGITTKVLDNGVGTMGVVKAPTLQNGWVAFAAGTATLQYIKSSDGMVHVFGAIASGTTANGTLIATLATGFRPSEIIRAPILQSDGATVALAEATIESDGSLRINFVTVSARVEFNLTFPASNLSNAVSAE